MRLHLFGFQATLIWTDVLDHSVLSGSSTSWSSFMKSPVEMYYLALPEYGIRYATGVYFARMTYLGLWKFRSTPRSTALAVELRLRYLK